MCLMQEEGLWQRTGILEVIRRLESDRRVSRHLKWMGSVRTTVPAIPMGRCMGTRANNRVGEKTALRQKKEDVGNGKY